MQRDRPAERRPAVLDHATRRGRAARHTCRSSTPSAPDSNIDFFHLYAAYDCIQRLVRAARADGASSASPTSSYGYLFESVRVIWYEAPKELDSTTLFTRLNVGRIPLTDAELVKALLLSRSRGGAGDTDRAHEIAAQWDSYRARSPASRRSGRSSQTTRPQTARRTSACCSTRSPADLAVARVRRFHTFDVLREKVEQSRRRRSGTRSSTCTRSFSAGTTIATSSTRSATSWRSGSASATSSRSQPGKTKSEFERRPRRADPRHPRSHALRRDRAQLRVRHAEVRAPPAPDERRDGAAA